MATTSFPLLEEGQWGAVSAEKVGEMGRKRGRSHPPGRSRSVPTSRQLFLHPQSEQHFSLQMKNLKICRVFWRKEWRPTPAFLPGESPGQRSLEGYSPRSYKESDTTERHFHFGFALTSHFDNFQQMRKVGRTV